MFDAASDGLTPSLAVAALNEVCTHHVFPVPSLARLRRCFRGNVSPSDTKATSEVLDQLGRWNSSRLNGTGQVASAPHPDRTLAPILSRFMLSCPPMILDNRTTSSLLTMTPGPICLIGCRRIFSMSSCSAVPNNPPQPLISAKLLYRLRNTR